MNEPLKPYVEYNICGNYIILIDQEDIPIVDSRKWHLNNRVDLPYFVAGRKSSTVRLHRLLINCPNGFVVDHINGNTLDNRKNNLRVCTHRENMANHKKLPTGASRETGIYARKNKSGMTYDAYISDSRKLPKTQKYLGTFKLKNDAVSARKKAELEIYGYSYNLRYRIEKAIKGEE